MSERIRQSVMVSLFRSNRFVIAACAAIAMVLGAMSVGASINQYPEITTQANITTVIDSRESSTAKPQAASTPEDYLPGQIPALKVQPLTNPSTTNQPLKVKNVADDALKAVRSTLLNSQSLLVDKLQGMQTTIDTAPLTGNLKVMTPVLTPVLAEPSSVVPLSLEPTPDPDPSAAPAAPSVSSPASPDPTTPQSPAAPI